MISAAIQQFLTEHPKAKVLDLSLTYHWYDEIEAGSKMEEYRELSDYYRSRLTLPLLRGSDIFRHYDYVLFHRGRFSPTTMLVQCDGIRIGYGREDWGAERGKQYFVIHLGDRVI